MTKKKTEWIDQLIDDDEKPTVSKSAARRANNDFNRMQSSEVLRRLYVRHSTGVWQTATVISIAVFAYVNVL